MIYLFLPLAALACIGLLAAWRTWRDDCAEQAMWEDLMDRVRRGDFDGDAQ